MNFELNKTVEILRQTPYTLYRMLDGLSLEWTESKGDVENWSPYDVIGHLIHGEETDWIPRAEIILNGEDRPFDKYDRLAQFERSRDIPLHDLLTEFAFLRSANIERLIKWQLTPEQLEMTGTHPVLGVVTLRNLLATWPVHDLTHIRQVANYMARLYETEVGPWKQYLSILQ